MYTDSGVSEDWTSLVEEFLLSIGRLSPRTVEFYSKQLRLLACWSAAAGISPQSFTARHLDRYDLHRRTCGSSTMPSRVGIGVGPNTRRHDAVCAKRLFRYAYRSGRLPRDPLADIVVSRPHDPHIVVPTVQELADLLRAFDSYYDPAVRPAARAMQAGLRLRCRRRNRAIVMLLIDTAARIHEILAATLSDYDPDQGRLLLRKTKNGKQRLVPVKADAVAAVSAWLRVRPREVGVGAGDLLFVSLFGEALTYRAFAKVFTSIRSYAGLRTFTIHGIRHYALSCLGDCDLKAAMTISGIQDAKTMNRYQHDTFERATAVHDEAAPLARLFAPDRTRAKKRRLF